MVAWGAIATNHWKAAALTATAAAGAGTRPAKQPETLKLSHHDHHH